MICSNCGQELKEEGKFCTNCGTKIVNNENKSREYIRDKLIISEDSFSEEYKSKLALANNAAEMFFKKENPSLFEYNQVCALFGQVEQIGGHINKTYIDELDFFIKANLIDFGIYFDTVGNFEKVYDNLMGYALLNTKTEEEKNMIKSYYNKEKIINEFREKLNIKLKERRKKYMKRLLVVVGIIILFLLPSIITSTLKNTNKSNINSNSQIVNKKIEYGSSIFEDSNYGEKVVRAYYGKYGSYTMDGVGKITSIVKSEFLEKDNYGRYAFKVTFKYNPKNGQGATMLDRESTKTVIAIYLLNLDDPYGLYVGIQNVKTTTSNWNTAKSFSDLCGGAWNTPVTLNFTN